MAERIVFLLAMGCETFVIESMRFGGRFDMRKKICKVQRYAGGAARVNNIKIFYY